jgi:hypothetical protein
LDAGSIPAASTKVKKATFSGFLTLVEARDNRIGGTRVSKRTRFAAETASTAMLWKYREFMPHAACLRTDLRLHAQRPGDSRHHTYHPLGGFLFGDCDDIDQRPRGGVGRVSKRTRFAAETASHREVLRLEIQGIHAACGMPANGFALASAKTGRFRHSSKSTFLKDGLGHPCLHEEYEQLLSHNL